MTTSLLGIVFWAAAVRFYTADVVGFSSATISAMVLVTGLASFSLQGVLVRFLPAAGAKAGRLILLAYAIHASMALLLGTLFVHTIALWAPNLGALSADGAAGWGFVLGAMVWSVFNLQDGALTGLRHAVWVPVENILYALGKMVLLVLLASGMPHWGIFAAWVLPAAAAIIPINLLLLGRLVPQAAKMHSPQVRAADRASIARYIVRNYPGALFSLALSALMPLVVSQQAGLRANAYFYMPWMIYTGLQLVPINLATSMTVEAVHDERKLGLFSYRVLMQSLRLLGPVVVALLLGAHWLLLAFGPEYAAQGETLVRLLALAAIPNILVVLYISVLRVENRGWNLVLVQATQARAAAGAQLLAAAAVGDYRRRRRGAGQPDLCRAGARAQQDGAGAAKGARRTHEQQDQQRDATAERAAWRRRRVARCSSARAVAPGWSSVSSSTTITMAAISGRRSTVRWARPTTPSR